MSALFRIAGVARSGLAPRRPLSTSFFSTATPRRPVPANFFKQPTPSMASKLRQIRSYTSGFGSQRQYAANMALVKGLMGVNVAVFGYGLYAREQHKQGYSSNLAKFMTNMTMSVNGFKRGYYWQAITSVFTHIDPIHLLFNMATFWFMGKFLAASSCITPGRYMAIVLGSGVAGSLGYLKSQEYKSQTDRFAEHQRGLGFSGALMGVTTVAACLSPRTKVAIWGVLPVPLGVLTLCYALYDGYYLNSKNSRTAHSGHLGGTAFGLLYYFLKLRGLKIPGSL